MKFNINNGRKIEVAQVSKDGYVYVDTIDSNGNEESTETITPGDFITMLNWYKYQKETGNKNLEF